MNISIFPSIVYIELRLRLPNGPCLIPLDNNCINTPSSNPRRVGLGEAGDNLQSRTDFSCKELALCIVNICLMCCDV